MNKQEFIVELTKQFDPNADQFYNNAIMAAIRLAHKLDEPTTTPVASNVYASALLTRLVVKTIETNCRVSLHEAEKLVIAGHVIKGEPLAAIKKYKDASGLGLKDSKEDIDKVQQELSVFWGQEP